MYLIFSDAKIKRVNKYSDDNESDTSDEYERLETDNDDIGTAGKSEIQQSSSQH